MTPRRPSDTDLLRRRLRCRRRTRAVPRPAPATRRHPAPVRVRGGRPRAAAGHHPRRGPVAGDDDRRRAHRGPGRPSRRGGCAARRPGLRRAGPSRPPPARSRSPAAAGPRRSCRRWPWAVPSAASSTTRSGRRAPAAASTVEVREDRRPHPGRRRGRRARPRQGARAHLDGSDHHRGPGLGQRRRVHVDPAAGRSPRGAGPHRPPGPRRESGGVMRLVVCDDHRLLVDALALALQDEGHEVVATPVRPGEAVDAVRVHQPDACLLDVSFPDASGLSVIGLIHAASPATKIIILSGSTDQTVVAEAIGKGAHGFVSKERPVVRHHRRPRAGPRRAHGRRLRPAPAGAELPGVRRQPALGAALPHRPGVGGDALHPRRPDDRGDGRATWACSAAPPAPTSRTSSPSSGSTRGSRSPR